jgi:broad specificity phosphatase PhoE
MGTIYVVRHAQASFGTEDYDRLTAVGFTQARLLGDFFKGRHIRFDALVTGTLRRHAETAQAIVGGDGPEPRQVPALDEYKPEALLLAFTGSQPDSTGDDAVRRDPEVVRRHFRLLRDALLAWAEDRIQPAGMPPWQQFKDDAAGALVAARRQFHGGNVLLVSSGGPIAAIVADSLAAPARTAVELNMRIRNTAVTEYATSANRHHLVTFNALPHLDTQPDAGLITYA